MFLNIFSQPFFECKYLHCPCINMYDFLPADDNILTKEMVSQILYIGPGFYFMINILYFIK